MVDRIQEALARNASATDKVTKFDSAAGSSTRGATFKTAASAPANIPVVGDRRSASRKPPFIHHGPSAGSRRRRDVANRPRRGGKRTVSFEAVCENGALKKVHHRPRQEVHPALLPMQARPKRKSQPRVVCTSLHQGKKCCRAPSLSGMTRIFDASTSDQPSPTAIAAAMAT